MLEKIKFVHVISAITEIGLLVAGFIITPYALAAATVLALIVICIEYGKDC